MAWFFKPNQAEIMVTQISEVVRANANPSLELITSNSDDLCLDDNDIDPRNWAQRLGLLLDELHELAEANMTINHDLSQLYVCGLAGSYVH